MIKWTQIAILFCAVFLASLQTMANAADMNVIIVPEGNDVVATVKGQIGFAGIPRPAGPSDETGVANAAFVFGDSTILGLNATLVDNETAQNRIVNKFLTPGAITSFPTWAPGTESHQSFLTLDSDGAWAPPQRLLSPPDEVSGEGSVFFEFHPTAHKVGVSVALLGQPMEFQLRWKNTTVAALGLVPDVYTWVLGNDEKIVLTISDQELVDQAKIDALIDFGNSETGATAPTDVSVYNDAGAADAVASNLEAYNNVLAALGAAATQDQPLTIEAVREMVSTHNAIISSATSGTASSLTVADYAKVSVTAVQAAEALVNDAIASADAEGVDTVDKLQAIANAAKTLTDFASATTSASAPVLSDYALLGMTGLAEANLDSYNSAVFRKGASTSTAIQAAISAYNAVLEGAGQGESATVTSQQYEDIAVTVTVFNDSGPPSEVLLAGEVLSIVNSAVGTQAKEASDTVTELRRMAKAADTIIQTATDVEDAGLVEEDFSVLGIVGVRAGNLSAVVTAVEDATASDLTSVPAIKAELPNLSDPVSVAALAGFDGEGDAPNKAVYESAGVAGVDEANVASYNSALATLTIAEDDLDAIQDVVYAYNAILSAVGTTNTSTLGVADFEALGLSVSAASLPLLREAISDLEAADINAIAGLSAVVGSVTKLAGQADEAVTNEAPAAADYTAVGVSSVVAANVSAYNSAVEASGASTSSALQAVVTTINAIAAAANGNPATVPSLEVTDYAAIGVTVPGPSLGLVNSSVGSQGASASNTDTKLSAIVTAVNKILATVGTSGQSSGLTVADFAALGVVGVTDANLDDAIVAIAAAEASDVQTLSAIQILLSDVLITPLPVPTLQFYALLLLGMLMLMMGLRVRRRV